MNVMRWIRKWIRQLIAGRKRYPLKGLRKGSCINNFATKRAWPAVHSAFDLKFKAPRGTYTHHVGVNFLQKPLPPRGREWGSPLKGRQGRRTWASELSVWERYERRSNIGGEWARGENLERGARVTSVHAHTRAFKGVYATRVHSRRKSATCMAHESAWKKEGCGQEDDGRESRWRRSPSSILHKGTMGN